MRLQLAEEGEFVPSSVAAKSTQEGEEGARATTSAAGASQQAPTTTTSTGHTSGGVSHRRDLAAIAAQINAKLSGSTEVTQFHAEVEINDLPQKARWRATNRVILMGCSYASRAHHVCRKPSTKLPKSTMRRSLLAAPSCRRERNRLQANASCTLSLKARRSMAWKVPKPLSCEC